MTKEGTKMIDRDSLKTVARQNLRGKKPNAYVISAVYVAIFSILLSLSFALSGYDRFFEYLEQIIPINPYPEYNDVAAMLPKFSAIAFILILSVFMAKLIIDVGFMRYCLKISRNEEADIKVLFDGSALYLKIVFLKLLHIFFITLWSLLFIFPGIIAYYSYRQSFYILLDKPDTAPLDCIRQSKRMMDGYKLELFFLDISFVGWMLLDQVVTLYATLRLFSIWLSPYIGVTRAGFYNQLLSDNADVKDIG